MAERYTAEDVDAALEALNDPSRFTHPQEVVAHAAPGLQRILNEVLHEGGFHTSALNSQVAAAAAAEDPEQRERAIRMLAAEEARLGMLVGAAIGLALAEQLRAAKDPTTTQED